MFLAWMKEFWEYRELFFFLVWRDVKIRYKQTVLGFLWALLQPLAKLIIFTLIFGRLAKMDSEGYPYALFVYAGLLPWEFFAEARGDVTVPAGKLAMLFIDQDARRDGIFVDFLGRPTSTVRGPAIFSIRKRCPIVALFLLRRGVDRHLAVIEKPIWPNPRLKGREAIRDLTQRYTRILEKHVRESPGQYFWMHRRWKTRPSGELAR
jgi:hypothetical protein